MAEIKTHSWGNLRARSLPYQHKQWLFVLHTHCEIKRKHRNSERYTRRSLQASFTLLTFHQPLSASALAHTLEAFSAIQQNKTDVFLSGLRTRLVLLLIRPNCVQKIGSFLALIHGP